MIVTVYNGSQLLESRPCRRFRLPDGRSGAFWRGLVYPYQEGDERIDAAGAAFSPSDCVAVDETAAESPRKFAFVDGDGEAYVLVAGSQDTRESALSALRGLNVEIVRDGRYLGDELDGFVADWFIRIVAGEGRRQGIEAALDLALGRSSFQELTTTDLKIRILRSELAEANRRNAAHIVEINRLRMSLASLSGSTAEERAAQARREEEYRLALEAERAARISAEQAALPPAAPWIKDDDTSEEAADALPDDQSPATKSKISDEISLVLETFLPRCRLLRDSLMVLSTEFSSRQSVYRSLAELDSSAAGMPPNWKKVQGLDRWWERHVTTGLSKAGRAYARLDQDKRAWSILISHKTQQTRDIKWLDLQ